MGGGHLLGVCSLMGVLVLFTITLAILFQTLKSFIFSKPKPQFLSVLNLVWPDNRILPHERMCHCNIPIIVLAQLKNKLCLAFSEETALSLQLPRPFPKHLSRLNAMYNNLFELKINTNFLLIFWYVIAYRLTFKYCFTVDVDLKGKWFRGHLWTQINETNKHN